MMFFVERRLSKCHSGLMVIRMYTVLCWHGIAATGLPKQGKALYQFWQALEASQANRLFFASPVAASAESLVRSIYKLIKGRH